MSASMVDDFVVLDPAVSIRELPPRKASLWSQGPAVRRGWLLVHDAQECAAVVPAGDGLGEVVEALRVPARTAELVDDPIGRELVEGLVRRGFGYARPTGDVPGPGEIDALRADWRARCGITRVERAMPRMRVRDVAELREQAHHLALDNAGTVEVEPPWHDLGADTAAAFYDAYCALAAELGDVRLRSFPADDEIAQEVLVDRAPPANDVERSLRARHLRARCDHLLELEGKIVWAQEPRWEDLWIPLDDDLVPNRPDLVGITEGSIVLDVAGGLGRVARRLAARMGLTTTIISVDKEPIISARARRFAAELGISSIEFRVGLAQRLPLGDSSVDAAVLEWGGEIYRDGLLARCLTEIERVLRPGKRLAITYRLCNVLLERATEVVAPYPEIYPGVLAAVAQAGLGLVAEKVWTTRAAFTGVPRAAFEERYLPRIIDDLRGRTFPPQRPSVDVMLTVVTAKALR